MDDPGKGVASHDEYSAHIVTATRPETDGPSVPIVMVIGHMWLLGRLRNDRGWHSTCVYEEGWHIASGPRLARARQPEALARSRTLQRVRFHKGTDIPANSPGMTMVQEADHKHLISESRTRSGRHRAS